MVFTLSIIWIFLILIDGNVWTKHPSGEPRTAKRKENRQLLNMYIWFNSEKTLGKGTFGKVKLATHIPTGEKVAIKILEKDRIIDVADV